MSITAKALLAKEIEPIKYVVDDLIPQGLLILAGPSKIGKSYLVNQLALAVSSGHPILGHAVSQGSVLYYALEDGENRLQERLMQQVQDSSGLDRITYETEARQVGHGLEDDIRAWHASTPDARLVIVDTLINVARGPRGVRDAYEHWSEVLAAPRQLARDLQIGIMFVHHVRKGGKRGEIDGDVFDGIHGSVAIVAMADAVYALKRDRMTSEAALSVTGRDIKEVALRVQRDDMTMTWQPAGSAIAPEPLGATRRQLDVFEVLAEGPLRNSEVAAKLGMSQSNTNQILKRSVREGYVLQVDRGPYSLHADVARLLAEAHGDGPSPLTELNEEDKEIDFGF